jgi:hypothetical protein
MMLEHNGRVLNEMIPFVYDAQGRTVGLRNSKEEHRVAKVNETPETSLTVGDHEVTISTGPSFQSEREESNEFVKTIIPQLENIVQDPVTRSKLLALLIKTRNIGPMGDEMVELLDPKDQSQQQLSQLQQQVAQNQQIIVGLKTENDKLYAEKQGHVVDNEYMLKAKQLDNEMKLAIAEITAKSQDANARATLTADLMKELHVAAHDAAKQAVQHAHEQSLQQQKAAQAQQSQSADQGHDMAMVAQQQQQQPQQTQ